MLSSSSTLPLGGKDFVLGGRPWNECVPWRMALLPKDLQKGILTSRSLDPKASPSQTFGRSLHTFLQEEPYVR